MSKSYSVPQPPEAAQGAAPAIASAPATDTNPASPAPVKTKPQCCVAGCSADAVTRGLCSKCYSSATALVKSKKTTWEELEKLGFAKPSQRDPSPSKLTEALAAAKKK